MVQKGRVHRLADDFVVVAPESERNIANAAARLGVRELLFQTTHRLEKLHGVVGVFVHAGADGEDVGVEDDVAGPEANLLGQDLVGAGGGLDLAVGGDGLAFLVEGHDDDGRPIALDEPSLFEELFLSLFETNRVDDPLALDALQPRFDDRPFRAVDHDRHFGDRGVGGDEVEEPCHRLLAVEEVRVHVHINDVGAVFHLLAGHH